MRLVDPAVPVVLADPVKRVTTVVPVPQAFLAQPAHLASLDVKERLEDPGDPDLLEQEDPHQEHLEHQEERDQRETQEYPVTLATQEPLVHQDVLDYQEDQDLMDAQEHQEHQVPWEQLDSPDFQAEV